MEVQEIEFIRLASDLLQHGHVQRVRVADRTVEAQRSRPERFKLRRGARVAACEQRHVMTERDQFLDEPLHDALGPSIELRWNRLGQRSDLGNAHGTFLLDINGNSLRPTQPSY